VSGSGGEPTEQSADALTDQSGRALGVERAQLVETTARIVVQVLTGRSAERA
jgi:hypothetical protein